MKPRLLTLIVGAAAGLLSYLLISESPLENAVFQTALALANSAEVPTNRHDNNGNPIALAPRKNILPPSKQPKQITIDEESQGVFQDFPPSPTDYAVIFSNLSRLGEESIAVNHPLAWQETDLISLTALDIQLDSIPNLITATPLSRTTTAAPPPPAIRRAAIPPSQISGNTNSIPIVNRIPLPGIVLGRETAKAGFTTLESEPSSNQPNLLARWENENLVLPSFALLGALQISGNTISDLRIDLGKSISLGATGPLIPIDDSGKLRANFNDNTQHPSIPAQNLIDATGDLLKNTPAGPIFIDLAIPAANPPPLTNLALALATPETFFVEKTYHRFGLIPTLLFIASLLSLLFGLSSYPKFRGALPAIYIAIALVALHFCLMVAANLWPPTLVLLCTIIPSAFIRPTQKTPAKPSLPESPEPKSTPPPEPRIPRKKDLPPLPGKPKR